MASRLTTSRYLFCRPISPKDVVNRRLPGITQRDAFTPGGSPIRIDLADYAANRWVVPGSRLFSHVRIGLTLRQISRGWRDTRQSGSPPDVGQSHTSSQPAFSRTRTTTRTKTCPTDPTSAIPLSRIGLTSLRQTRLEIPGTETGE